MASGMGVVPGRERQAPVQQALQGLRPSLQAELPGGGGVLPTLSIPSFQKVKGLGFKMGGKNRPRRPFWASPYDFSCWTVPLILGGRSVHFERFPITERERRLRLEPRATLSLLF